MDEQAPAESLVVTDLETLRVVSDALRARILDCLRAAPLTAKQLGAQLGLTAKQLYYHLGLMERHGLIRVVRTRIVSGILEKQYRATAYLFLFDNEVFSPAQGGAASGLPPGLGMLFDSTRNQLAQSYEAGLLGAAEGGPAEEAGLVMGWRMAELSPERAESFRARLHALLLEFDAVAEQPSAEDGQAYRLFLMLFPVRRARPANPTDA